MLKTVCNTAQSIENITFPPLVQLELSNDESIKNINEIYRGIACTTDVLSFPSILYPEGFLAGNAEHLFAEEWDTANQAYYIGDIIISTDRAAVQAQNFGHSFERELCYLLVHGLFHLFGYDHLREADKIIMRRKEEQVMNAMGQFKNDDAKLLELARKAMTEAYVPYSKFQGGACLQSEDGRLYTGCNVENASYGLTNCAERTAIFKAVSEGAKQFTVIAIAAQSMPPWPCGACRQVLSEFCEDLRILVTWGDGEVVESTLKELLPHSFSPSSGVQEFLGKDSE
ncbi:MAG: cytidine deaminase [Clostridiales bacterium]|nr:cytidine deaminase [Clostridiales bacterium]